MGMENATNSTNLTLVQGSLKEVQKSRLSFSSPPTWLVVTAPPVLVLAIISLIGHVHVFMLSKRQTPLVEQPCSFFIRHLTVCDVIQSAIALPVYAGLLLLDIDWQMDSTVCTFIIFHNHISLDVMFWVLLLYATECYTTRTSKTTMGDSLPLTKKYIQFAVYLVWLISITHEVFRVDTAHKFMDFCYDDLPASIQGRHGYHIVLLAGCSALVFMCLLSLARESKLSVARLMRRLLDNLFQRSAPPKRVHSSHSDLKHHASFMHWVRNPPAVNEMWLTKWQKPSSLVNCKGSKAGCEEIACDSTKKVKQWEASMPRGMKRFYSHRRGGPKVNPTDRLPMLVEREVSSEMESENGEIVDVRFRVTTSSENLLSPSQWSLPSSSANLEVTQDTRRERTSTETLGSSEDITKSDSQIATNSRATSDSHVGTTMCKRPCGRRNLSQVLDTEDFSSSPRRRRAVLRDTITPNLFSCKAVHLVQHAALLNIVCVVCRLPLELYLLSLPSDRGTHQEQFVQPVHAALLLLAWVRLPLFAFSHMHAMAIKVCN